MGEISERPRAQYVLIVSITGVIWVQLQAEQHYVGFGASCRHLTHSQIGSQLVSQEQREAAPTPGGKVRSY